MQARFKRFTALILSVLMVLMYADECSGGGCGDSGGGHQR